MTLIDKVVQNVITIANDDSYQYGKWSSPHGNGLGNVENPKYLDCCTSICLAIYRAMAWSWKNQTHGYYWPHVSQNGYDYFLTKTLGAKKTWYGNKKLEKGDILITSETYGHTAIMVDDKRMFEANPYYADSIAIRNFYEMDWLYVYTLPGGYDDMTATEKYILEAVEDTELYKACSKDLAHLVSYVQAYLQFYGWYTAEIDGDYGPVTESAVCGWQDHDGRPVTGRIGKADWQQIRKG